MVTLKRDRERDREPFCSELKRERRDAAIEKVCKAEKAGVMLNKKHRLLGSRPLKRRL
jgi:hypothetical protein